MRVLTFNVSAGNLSHWAPLSFTLSQKYQAVVEMVVAHRAELVSLQELDNAAARSINSALQAAGWRHCGAAESHCGSTHIWVHGSLQAKPKPSVGPVAMTQISLPLPESVAASTGAASGCFYFAGCHLEPFADGAPVRLQQLDQVRRSLPPLCRLVLAGDMNMRNAENTAVEALGLSDAFKAAGSPWQHNFTWNSTVNRYHGPSQKAYTARYDRIYLRGFIASDIRLVADAPLSADSGAYLSDHFGLLSSIHLITQPPPVQPPEREAEHTGEANGRG